MNRLLKPWFDQENKQDYFCCMWNLTRECNSCCVGCPFHNNINNRLIDPKKVITFISNNFNFNTNYNQIILFGGEPTLHKQFNYIITELSKLKFKNKIIFSNFSADIDTYNDCLFKDYTLILTYHNNIFQNIEQFIEKIIKLKLTNYSIILMRDEKTNYNYNKLISYVPKEKINIVSTHKEKNNLVDSHHVIQNYNCITIDEFGRGKTWSDVIESNKNCFTGYSCTAGKLSFFIEENGDIFPCHGIAQDYYIKNKNSSYLYGNIDELYKSKLNFDKCTICPQKACRFELFLTKELIE